jgi:hypothetical protein
MKANAFTVRSNDIINPWTELAGGDFAVHLRQSGSIKKYVFEAIPEGVEFEVPDEWIAKKFEIGMDFVCTRLREMRSDDRYTKDI